MALDVADGISPQCPRRLRLNVSGALIETAEHTFDRFPNSLLGCPVKRRRLWNELQGEYFLERHRPSFEAIFQFYQTGYLRRPSECSLTLFLDELQSYEFDESVIIGFKQVEGIVVDRVRVVPDNKIQRMFWQLFDDPNSSIYARMLGVFSISIIVISITSFCMETLPDYKHLQCLNVTVLVGENGTVRYHLVPNYGNIFFRVDTFCVAWFTIEYVVRLVTCPLQSRLHFFTSKLNLIDVLTIVPYFAILAVSVHTASCAMVRRSASVLFFRILRIFRVFKLTKHFKEMQLFVFCIKNSLRELKLFLFITCIGSLLLASSIVTVEADVNQSQLTNIFEGVWWAIATMTTVGYGDVYPITKGGKFVAVVAFILGCLVVALPTPIIVSNFNRYYRKDTGRGNG